MASVFGAITPFCSCSSIPLFIGFMEAKIPFGVAMSFLITSPMINEIAILVLMRVFVGAFLHGYIPKEFFITYMGDNNIFAVPMAVIVGIPLYADATTIIPIAEVLIQKGAATGTVLVFMMAVVCLSLPEMIILSRVMKKELIIRYVIFMFLAFTLVGYFYNFILQFFKKIS